MVRHLKIFYFDYSKSNKKHWLFNCKKTKFNSTFKQTYAHNSVVVIAKIKK